MNTLNPRELAAFILGKAALIDSTVPKPDPNVLAAWEEILAKAPALTAEQARVVVTEHYATSTKRIMPADVVTAARARGRAELPPAEPRALPSRFETDEERLERIRSGVAQWEAVRDARKTKPDPEPGADIPVPDLRGVFRNVPGGVA